MKGVEIAWPQEVKAKGQFKQPRTARSSSSWEISSTLSFSLWAFEEETKLHDSKITMVKPAASSKNTPSPERSPPCRGKVDRASCVLWQNLFSPELVHAPADIGTLERFSFLTDSSFIIEQSLVASMMLSWESLCLPPPASLVSRFFVCLFLVLFSKTTLFM